MAKKRKGSASDIKMRNGWILVIVFLLLLLMVRKFDVRPIGPESTEVGLAFLNGPLHDLIGHHPLFYTISKISGGLVLLVAAGFAILGVLQLVQRRSLFEVDSDILLLGAFYVLLLIIYIFFEKVVINYRPIILDEGKEASFPSSHSLLALVICGTGMIQLNRRLRGTAYRDIAVDILGVLALVTVICRFLSGVHWFTDILAGVSLGAALVFFYSALEDRLIGGGRGGKKYYSGTPGLFVLILCSAIFFAASPSETLAAGHAHKPETEVKGPGIGLQTQAGSETGSEAGAGTEEAQTQAAETGQSSSAQAAAAQSSSGSGTLTMIAAGDNLIHKTIVDKAWRPEIGNYDFHFLYTPILDTIQSRDLAVINQETIFISDNALISDYPTFGTPQVMGEALVDSGFDIVLSATNHTWDKGLRGVSDTLNYWKTVHPEIKLLGIHESPEAFNTIDYVEKNGIRLAMFNYTYGLNGFSASQYYFVNLLSQQGKFLQDVRTAESEADMTVCFLHIGEEYHYQPTAYQQGYVHSLIDAGADLVICAHPHVVEPAGFVTTAAGNTGLVFWSCGNLISAQTKIPRILGGLADVTITKDQEGTRITDWDFIPTVTHFCGPDVRAFLLKDYPEELAAVNHVNYSDAPLTTEKLWNLWTSITGRGR
ncbi:MAG: CapA family protein [Stomatobaculum sp.]|nr:CapA family protein [Stomatobaculum sp.]